MPSQKRAKLFFRNLLRSRPNYSGLTKRQGRLANSTQIIGLHEAKGFDADYLDAFGGGEGTHRQLMVGQVGYEPPHLLCLAPLTLDE